MPYPTENDELDFEDQAGEPAPAPPLQQTIDPSLRGRMYMGPAMSPEAEAQFTNSGVLAPGLRIAPPAPVGPPAMAMQDKRAADLASVPGAQNMDDVITQRRMIAGTPPGNKLLSGISRPEPPPPDQEMMEIAQKMGAPLTQAIAAIESQRRYQAQRGYQADIKAGMSATDAMTKWGPLLFAGPKGAGAMPKQAGPLPGTSPQTFTDPQGNTFYLQGNKWVHVPRQGVAAPQMETITERQPQVAGKPGVPAVPPGTGFLGTGLFASAGSPEVPAVPASPARTITRRVPVAAPPPVAPNTATATNAPARPPVIRITKDGKRAKFDPATKQFLGYAD